MEEIKFMCIYMDNSCEVHFDSADNSKLILSPCGSAFVYRTYDDNVIKNTLKYRTAYAISIFSYKLRTILKARNRFCNDRPFISPILLEDEHQYWFSSDDFTTERWDTTEMNLHIKNPIEVDYSKFYYTWKSVSGHSTARLHFNKKIFEVTYPVQVPISTNDEYEQNCANYDRFKQSKKTPNSKHILKYTLNNEEFSVAHMSSTWQNLYNKMSQLVDEFSEARQRSRQLSILDESKKSSQKTEICVKLSSAMPLSCSSTHLHRFDNIETTSEPKVIYMDKTWYKNKSIEISSEMLGDNKNMNVSNSPMTDHENEADNFVTCCDYLISDTPSGRYFSCYSLNKRAGNVEDSKICSENIPSFKVYLKKTVNYAQIFLKRINNVKIMSNHSICYMSNKFHELEMTPDSLSNIPCVPIDQVKNQSSLSAANLSSVSNSQTSLLKRSDLNIKKQFVIEDVGHFKFFRNNTIVIYFVDKIKLFMEEQSLENFLANDLNNSSCYIYLPDNSQHEINLSDSSEATTHFNKYIGFLKQWLNWLLENNTISGVLNCHAEKTAAEEMSLDRMKAHLNSLRLFNFTMNQDTAGDNTMTDSHGLQSNLSNLSVSNLLKENSKFLRNITGSD